MYNTLKIIRNFQLNKCRNRIIYFSARCRSEQWKRHINTSARINVKMFLEHENNYAYNILISKGFVNNLYTPENIPITKEQYNALVCGELSNITPKEIFELFPKLGSYCKQNNLCITNKIFDNFIDNLTDTVNQTTDKELETLFYSLSQWPETESIRSRNFIEVWAALDDECMKRVNNWTFDQMLSFVALFFMLNVSRHSEFSMKCLQKLATKAKQLTPEQLVKTMFFIGVHRKSPFDMHNLEVQISNKLSKFSVDELAIIAMGFFKSKTPIRNLDLVAKIVHIVINNAKTIHEVSLAALLKIIRYSMKIQLDNSIYEMLDVLQHEVQRLSVMCNVHVALVGTSTLTLHRQCLINIADTILESISKTRMKDLERLVLTYGTFNLVPKTKVPFFERIIDELRKPEREIELQNYGRSFACCVSYLGLVGLYPEELINKILNPVFLENTYGKYCYNYGREILAINNTVEIFCNKSNLSVLNKKEVTILSKKYTEYMPTKEYVGKKYNVSEKMTLDVLTTLKQDRGEEFVIGDHILTHHQKGDIILCNNPDGKPMPVKMFKQNKNFGLIQRPPDDNVWIVLVIAGRNSMIRNSHTPTGFFLAKVKELQAIGYHAQLVPWSMYQQLQNFEDKSDYLNSLINESLKNGQ